MQGYATNLRLKYEDLGAVFASVKKAFYDCARHRDYLEPRGSVDSVFERRLRISRSSRSNSGIWKCPAWWTYIWVIRVATTSFDFGTPWFIINEYQV